MGVKPYIVYLDPDTAFGEEILMYANIAIPIKGEHEYLLEHFRQSGVFKCFECIYCKREDTCLGNEYKCVHDGVAVHCATKDEYTVMQGCACFWFEPRRAAGEAVAHRKARIMEQVRSLADFANAQIEHTPDGHTAQERQLTRIYMELQSLGVRL